jgi:hypothetical protein
MGEREVCMQKFLRREKFFAGGIVLCFLDTVKITGVGENMKGEGKGG